MTVLLMFLTGKSMKASDLEWWLVKKGVVTNSELDEDPRVTEVEEGRSGLQKEW